MSMGSKEGIYERSHRCSLDKHNNKSQQQQDNKYWKKPELLSVTEKNPEFFH
jgi:hypothetical protein